ncbi:MAG: hypothetical protein V4550_13955 [Gemmatimonadota bacterium]
MRSGLAVVLLTFLAQSVGAQNVTAPLDEGVKPEARADLVRTGSRTSLQLGGGVQIPAGYYARVGILGSVAVMANGGRADRGRLDVTGRFLLDPFRQSRWGLSAGAGLSIRVPDGIDGGPKPYLLAVVDLEGPRSASGISPAFQIGLGGGLRIGAALRWGGVRAR